MFILQSARTLVGPGHAAMLGLAIALLCGPTGCKSTSGPTSENKYDSDDGVRDFGGRTAKSIGWDFVEIYEYADHVKEENGTLKVNPGMRTMQSGQRLAAHPGKERSTYLWVAVNPNMDGSRDLSYRWGPEDPMPGAPDGGTPDKPKKAKYGHATLTGWLPAMSGGEIHFRSAFIEINNDSGRINKFYPNAKVERASFLRRGVGNPGTDGNNDANRVVRFQRGEGRRCVAHRRRFTIQGHGRLRLGIRRDR
jgi:hypothetical protein